MTRRSCKRRLSFPPALKVDEPLQLGDDDGHAEAAAPAAAQERHRGLLAAAATGAAAQSRPGIDFINILRA
jgi:hypothetical protein